MASALAKTWGNLPPVLKIRFCEELELGARYGKRDWGELPSAVKAQLIPLLLDTDPDDRSIRMGRVDGKPIYRASMAGRCDKELLLYRLSLDVLEEQMAEPKYTPIQVIRLKDKGILGAREGSRHEAWIIADLIKSGYEVTWHGDQQRELEKRFKRFVVRSHPDGMIRGNELGRQWHVLECKALKEERWELWNRDGWDGFGNYAHQVSLEMDLSGRPAFFIVKNRNSGQHSVPTLVQDPPVNPKEIYRKFSQIENAFEEAVGQGRGMLLDDFQVDCPPSAEWYFCPFFHQGYCDVLKKHAKGEEGEIPEVEDSDLVSLLEVFEEYKTIVKEAEAAKKSIRAAIVDHMLWPKLKCGEYFVALNKRSRKYFNAKAAKVMLEQMGEKLSDYEGETGYEELRVKSPKKEEPGAEEDSWTE